jgi:DNA-binding GntR family transcriptional regulator
VNAARRSTGRAAGLESSPRRDTVAIAAERLRQLIVTGEISPGAELSQVALAGMIGVSTTPVREALRQLEAEGLVESRRNRRPRVTAFDPGDLDAVYCSRVLLESTALSITVPAMTATDLDAIEADLDAMRAAGAGEDLAAWDEAHSSFHNRLVADCGPALRRQIRLTMSRADRYRRMSVLGERPYGWALGESEHAAIFHACEQHDTPRAVSLLASHLARSAFSVLDHLAPDHRPVALAAALKIVGVDGQDTGLT